MEKGCYTCGRSVAEHLVKVAQQPGRGGGEGPDAAEGVPDGQRAADELVAAGGFHRVDAHVGAPQSHRALRRERACWVVLGHHQPMPEQARENSSKLHHLEPNYNYTSA